MVIHCLTAYMFDDELDCEVYKDEEHKKESDALSKSCYKPVREGGRDYPCAVWKNV